MALGHHDFVVDGHTVAAQQRPEAFDFFTKFFNEHTFDRVIEIGTAHGGLTFWLRKFTGLPVVTYDIVEKPLYPVLREAGVDVRIKNVLNPANAAEIAADLQRPGRVLLLCDGGAKSVEFNTFAGFLKDNDCIMAHDYSRDESTYAHTQTLWPWWELRWSDIEAASERYGLQQIVPESEAVVWIVMQKTR
jgi:hypothetical protein